MLTKTLIKIENFLKLKSKFHYFDLYTFSWYDFLSSSTLLEIVYKNKDKIISIFVNTLAKSLYFIVRILIRYTLEYNVKKINFEKNSFICLPIISFILSSSNMK